MLSAETLTQNIEAMKQSGKHLSLGTNFKDPKKPLGNLLQQLSAGADRRHKAASEAEKSPKNQKAEKQSPKLEWQPEEIVKVEKQSPKNPTKS